MWRSRTDEALTGNLKVVVPESVRLAPKPKPTPNVDTVTKRALPYFPFIFLTKTFRRVTAEDHLLVHPRMERTV
jgi:hypothetical protein